MSDKIVFSVWLMFCIPIPKLSYSNCYFLFLISLKVAKIQLKQNKLNSLVIKIEENNKNLSNFFNDEKRREYERSEAIGVVYKDNIVRFWDID